MKTQRRRERVDCLTTSDSNPILDDLNGVDGTESIEERVSLESNGTSEHKSNGNGSAPGNDSANGETSPAYTQPGNGARTLPKRRRITSTTTVFAPKPANGAQSTTVVEHTKSVAATATIPLAPAPVAAPAAIAEPLAPWRLWLTYENLFWLGLFALTIVTRFWDIGNRGIHHDESLHSVFSHTLYKGGGYIHDPMMHGPLQFHFIALMYWLFGATDATARFASATCGIFVVMSPFFLRRQLGRVTALVCSFLLFISPSILYFSRMAREDAIFSGMEMIMIVGLWRFISTRRPGDFYIFCAGLALMFTIKETSYLTVAVLGVFFVAMFAYQAGYAIMGALGAYLVAMGGLYKIVNDGMKAGTISKLPNIPDQGPKYEQITAFAWQIIRHPLIQGALVISLVFGAIIVGLFILQRSRLKAAAQARATATALPSRRVIVRSSEGTPTMSINGHAAGGNGAVVEPVSALETTPAVSTLDSDEASEVWNPNRLDPKPGSLLSRYEAGSLPHLIGSLFSRPSVLLIGLLIAATIFTTLYTVFFSDIPHGIASGLFASIGYWMAQQGVERGGQPWYYYMLLVPIYEPIAVFFSLAATIFFSWRGVRWLISRFSRQDSVERAPHLGLFNTDRPVPFASFNALLPIFLITWLLGVFVLYSWAGEKMPWLMMHITRPAIFLASLFIGALVASVIARRRARIEEAGLLDQEYDVDERVISRSPIAARGALFTLSNVNEMARHAGLTPRKLATEAGAASTHTFSMSNGSSRRSGGIPAPPPRRGAAAARVAPLTYDARTQDPPWVTWNRPGSFFPIAFFLTAFTLLVLAWGLKMNALTYFTKYGEWGVTWIFPIIILLMVVLYSVWVGPGRALRYLGLGILTMGLLYEFRSAVNLAYNQPDVPKEMAVYVQTSPDTTRTIKELHDYALLSAGDTKQFKVVYDSFTSWPMEWYLRDYNKRFIGGDKARPAQDETVLLLEYAKSGTNAINEEIKGYQKQIDDLQKQAAAPERDNQIKNIQSQMQGAQNLLNNYVQQRYSMRWWFPEEWYKNDFLPGLDPKTSPINQQIGGALHTTWATISQPELTATVWKYLVFREPPKSLGSEDMVVLLRKDIAQQYHYLQYKPLPSTDVPSIHDDNK